MNFAVALMWMEELFRAGPDIFTLVKDVIRAINDFRTGKLTSDEFNVLFDDIKRVVNALLAPKPAA